MNSSPRKNIVASTGHAAALVLGLVAAAPSLAVDFIRGDANSDGVVSIADSYYLLSFMFLGHPPPECLSSGDVDDKEDLNITDAVKILDFLILGGVAPPSPFPTPGPDPTSNGGGSWIRCDSYGSGSTLEDPAAGLAIVEAVAPGGADGIASVTLAVSGSAAIAGFSGIISFPGGVIQGVKEAMDLSGTFKNGFKNGKVVDGKLRFGYLSSIVESASIPAGQDIPALRLRLCLGKGVLAGEYPLTLEAGELVDKASGRAVPPALVSGTLRVLADVQVDGSCPGSSGPGGDPPPPPPPPPETISATYRLGSATAAPGQEIRLPFIIDANVGVAGYAFSVDFDEEVLQALEVEDLFEYPHDRQEGFKIFEINNNNANSGNGGVDEGFIIGAEVFSFHERINLPLGQPPVAFRLRVNLEATAATTEVRFQDGGQGRGQPVRNVITAYGKNYLPELGSSYVYLSGFVKVIDDITTFIRGDSNGDRVVDITDPTVTLDYLFLGGGPPHCFDAADANDDGGVDIGDPVATLYSLFLGTGPLPPPSTPGEDPTPDSMGCLFK